VLETWRHRRRSVGERAEREDPQLVEAIKSYFVDQESECIASTLRPLDCTDLRRDLVHNSLLAALVPSGGSCQRSGEILDPATLAASAG
jgi:hypothetical protein